MSQKYQGKANRTSLSSLSLPKSLPTLKDQLVAPRYPWPLIMWPIEREAIAKLKELRREFKKKHPDLARLLKQPHERRGRPKGSSPLYSEQSFVIAILQDVHKVKLARILEALNKGTAPEDYHWLKPRLERGMEALRDLSPEDLKAWESVNQDTLLASLPIFPSDSIASK